MVTGIGWLAGAGKQAKASQSENLLEAVESLERILTQNILPFWFPGTLDSEFGGYSLNHDVIGCCKSHHSAKCLVNQARTMWFFSAIARSRFRVPEHLNSAHHGYRFLQEHMWDRDYGGFYWEVDFTTNVTAPGKHMYGQAFALYALSEYVSAGGETAARHLADTLWQLMEDKSHDDEFGGYLEALNRDWTAQTVGSSYLHANPGSKLMNTHIHILEALMSYYRVSRNDQVRERIVELVLILSSAVVRKGHGACSNTHARNWAAFEEKGGLCVSYGHDLEMIWLLIEACRLVQLPVAPLLDLFKTLFSNALRYGFDRRKGGFFLSGPPGKHADHRVKTWWVQAEALICALEMYRITSEDLYLNCFRRTLDWVIRHQVDWVNGDWHANISRSGKAFGNKAGPWKTAYHNGRSMLVCIEQLEALSAYT